MEVHETRERMEHAEHALHRERKRTALLIIIIAVALALTEMAGKEAEFASIKYNIEASDIYAFYQAKTIRTTVLDTAVESAEALAGESEARNAQVAAWRATIARLDSDLTKGEGRTELLAKARELQQQGNDETQSYHDFEVSSAALQLAIVVASAAVIVELVLLEFVSLGFFFVGAAFALVGLLAPGLLHF